MHQETLALHLASGAVLVASASPLVIAPDAVHAPQRTIRSRAHSRRHCHARHRPPRERLRVGQRVSRAPGSREQLRHRTSQRHQRTVHGVRRGRRLSRPAVVAAGGLGVDRIGRRRASSLLGARWRPLVLARHVRTRAAAPGLARLREPGRSPRLRAMARLRLPTEAEFHRAAFGTPEGRERRYPWGETADAACRRNSTSCSWDPEPAGAHPEGASALGVHDLVGNGWEWTSTRLRALPGFAPMPSYPEYSADFFDGDHFVMKGASPRRRGRCCAAFRNWFRPRYPYVYATFRCAGRRDVVSIGRRLRCLRAPIRRGCRGLPAADAAPAAVALFLRRAGLGALRRDLPAALVSRSRARRPRCSIAHAREILAPLPRPLTHRRSSGCGNGEKLAIAARARTRRAIPARASRSTSLRRAPERARATGDAARPTSGVDVSRHVRSRSRSTRHASQPEARGCVLFLGSNIGNFDPPAAREMSAPHSRVARRRATRC